MRDLIRALWRVVRPFRSRGNKLAPGDRVVFVDAGTRGTVHVSGDGYSHVYWDDEPELGGSRVPNAKLRRERT